jgi:nickel-dependent lactate racemase
MAHDYAPGAAQRLGGPERVLPDDEVRSFVMSQLGDLPLGGRSVCVLVPDATRTCPLPLLLGAVHGALRGRVSRLTVLIALGTHGPMSGAQIATHLGFEPGRLAARYPGTVVLNHEWWDPACLAPLGVISRRRVEDLSEGRLDREVAVTVNRLIPEHDVTLIVGPVFPHEVAGFSGGNKYLFPGVSGREIIDLSHWLGALITSAEIIGTRGVTPVRAMIDEAASMVPSERLGLCVVTGPPGTLRSVSFGPAEGAWADAADVSAACHVKFLDRPVGRVLSILPTRYEDMWTGAKGFYKVEPVVADGGQVVIYAPHIAEVSAQHPTMLDIGYHCRDYFVKQWDRFRGLPWAEMAHSTHLRGAGTWDADHGERGRVTVTLATGIPEAVVRSVALDYLDPSHITPAEWAADPHTLVVEDAGEDLYRLDRGLGTPAAS